MTLFDLGPKNKKCLTYCGDDRCDCSANPKYMMFRKLRKKEIVPEEPKQEKDK